MGMNETTADAVYARSIVVLTAKDGEDGDLRLALCRGAQYDLYNSSANEGAIRAEFSKLAHRYVWHAESSKVTLHSFGLCEIVQRIALPILEQYFDRITLICIEE